MTLEQFAVEYRSTVPWATLALINGLDPDERLEAIQDVFREALKPFSYVDLPR